MVVITETQDVFYGQVLNGRGDSEEFRKVEIKSERALSITMAALDTSIASDEYVQVILATSETNKHILCTLSKQHNVFQQKIDLQINAGETVNLYLNCKQGNVHLTGYYAILESDEFDDQDEEVRRNTLYNSAIAGGEFDDEFDSEDDDDEDEEDDDDDDEDDDDEDDDDEDEDDEDEEEDLKQNNKKRKLDEGKSSANGAAKNKKVDDEKAPKLVPNDSQPQKSAEGATKTLKGGVLVKETKIGSGPEAKKGKFVHVYYSGKLKTGKQFDKCLSGKPFKFRLGGGDVIKGWDVGIEGMKVGGKRTITIPPAMGYGSQRMGNDIPANSTLVFDVELKAVS